MNVDAYFDFVERVHTLDGLAEDLTDAVCSYSELRDMLKIVESKDKLDSEEQSEIPLCVQYLLQKTTVFQMLASKIKGMKDLILDKAKELDSEELRIEY